MNPPPAQIDRATVIEWAWSGAEPFGEVHGNSTGPIFGLAIAAYENEAGFYRFSCDRNWESVQDEIYDSVEDAKHQLPEQYKGAGVGWQNF
jgi:hypothetical protein